MEKELQNREISGITAKQLVWFMGGVISIIITVVMSYASIKSAIVDTARQVTEIRKASDTRDINVEAIKTELQNIKTEFATLELKVTMMQSQLTKSK